MCILVGIFTENRELFGGYCTTRLTLVTLPSMAAVALDGAGGGGDLAVFAHDSHDGLEVEIGSMCCVGLEGHNWAGLMKSRQ